LRRGPERGEREQEVKSMTGEYQHNLDAKGRLFIPARMREELGEVFYVTLSMDRCLSAYSGESWQNFSDKVNAMPYVKQRKMRPLFAYAARCELDKQGRVLLPQNLREYAGLDKNVTVVGCNNHAEFWDSDAWAEINTVETTPENIAAVMEELEF
jgi:MraZ protein